MNWTAFVTVIVHHPIPHPFPSRILSYMLLDWLLRKEGSLSNTVRESR
jgi:hypothetical protein